jgi:hypothetical protein
LRTGAVSLHLNLWAPPAQYGSKGGVVEASLDIAGCRYDELCSDVVKMVLKHDPREG